jgi:hypothetical protein
MVSASSCPATLLQQELSSEAGTDNHADTVALAQTQALCLLLNDLTGSRTMQVTSPPPHAYRMAAY